jgi:hypothetical protein
VSQTARILAVLQDGQPHLVSEIHTRSGYSRLNSRISDLRARGYVIECFKVPHKTGSEGYGYTLISEPPTRVGETASRQAHNLETPGSTPGRATSLHQPCPAESQEPSGQLSLPALATSAEHIKAAFRRSGLTREQIREYINQDMAAC